MATIKFNDQDYTRLRRELFRDRRKFIDPTFLPETASLDPDSRGSDIEWRRPTELVNDPHLVVDGVTGSDVMQGERGNAWFVTASAALTSRPGQLSSVMPNWTQQDYGDDFHPGIFRFVFSRHGGLYEIVIDDLLPTRKGRLVYAQSCEQNEFWSALLEKAYAKLHGNYASLSRGRVVDAVASFVRGIPEHWDLRQMCQPGAQNGINPDSTEDQADLIKQFHAHLIRHSLILFSLQPDNRTTRMGDWTKECLVYGRGYILTDIQQTRLKDRRAAVTLLKFQNAWFDMEWTGPWSDSAPEWKSVSLEFKDKIRLVDKKDGIFWMSIGDVLKQFTDIDICVVTGAGSIRSWLIYAFHNEWSVEQSDVDRREGEYSAGGSYEYKDTYCTNPQYLLTIPGEHLLNVSFFLEQGNPSTACYTAGQLEIGMDIFQVELNRRCRAKEIPREAWLSVRAKPDRQPSVLLKAGLMPGNYLVMPCTREPGQQQSFTLSAFSQSDYAMKLLPESVPRPTGTCACCQWKMFGVTRLIITKVTGINAYLKSREMLTSVRVDCEASDVLNTQSGFLREDKTEKDTFYMDFKVLLYRHQLLDPIDIEVFSQSAVSFIKTFVGVAAILDKNCPEETPKETPLFRHGKQLPVKLYCTVQSSTDIDYF